jgi:hypothetical protein
MYNVKRKIVCAIVYHELLLMIPRSKYFGLSERANFRAFCIIGYYVFNSNCQLSFGGDLVLTFGLYCIGSNTNTDCDGVLCDADVVPAGGKNSGTAAPCPTSLYTSICSQWPSPFILLPELV